VGWASGYLQGFGIELSVQDLVVKAKEWSGKLAEVLGSGAAVFLSATPTVLFEVLLVYMAWFLFLVRGRQMRNMLIPFLLPWPREREMICKTTGDVIRSIVVSNVLVSMIQAFLVLLILFIAKVPHASLWAGMAFFMSFIPVVGTAPVVIGAGLYSYLNGHMGMAIFVGIASLLVAAFACARLGGTELLLGFYCICWRYCPIWRCWFSAWTLGFLAVCGNVSCS
jgi:predicted PurR-regulated permease PerM